MPLVTIGPRKGYKMSVDDADMELIQQYKWSFVMHYKGANEYGEVRRTTYPQVSLARLLMDPPSGKVVDHIDGNPLNNSRSNLRVCTWIENAWNRGGTINAEQLPSGRWRAYIGHNGQLLRLGTYDTKEEAQRVADAKKRELYGEYTRERTK